VRGLTVFPLWQHSIISCQFFCDNHIFQIRPFETCSSSSNLCSSLLDWDSQNLLCQAKWLFSSCFPLNSIICQAVWQWTTKNMYPSGDAHRLKQHHITTHAFVLFTSRNVLHCNSRVRILKMNKRVLCFVKHCSPSTKDLWFLPLWTAASHRQWCFIYDSELYVVLLAVQLVIFVATMNLCLMPKRL
jgi:hypothetical protein